MSRLVVLVLLPLLCFGCVADFSKSESEGLQPGDPLGDSGPVVVEATATRGLPVDTVVTVQLRRDLLGLTGAGPVGIKPFGRNRDDFGVAGSLARPIGDWVVVRLEDETVVYIPRDAVLAIVVETNKPAAPR